MCFKVPQMADDRVDSVLSDWESERPELDSDCLALELRFQLVARRMAAEVTSALSELDLEWFEYDVLSALRRQGPPFQLSASDITEAAMISPGAVTNRIDRLKKRGLVSRVEDAEDRRRVIIGLTQAGIDLANQASEARFACADRSLGGLDAAQLAHLDQLLRDLIKGMPI